MFYACSPPFFHLLDPLERLCFAVLKFPSRGKHRPQRRFFEPPIFPPPRDVCNTRPHRLFPLSPCERAIQVVDRPSSPVSEPTLFPSFPPPCEPPFTLFESGKVHLFQVVRFPFFPQKVVCPVGNPQLFSTVTPLYPRGRLTECPCHPLQCVGQLYKGPISQNVLFPLPSTPFWMGSPPFFPPRAFSFLPHPSRDRLKSLVLFFVPLQTSSQIDCPLLCPLAIGTNF